MKAKKIKGVAVMLLLLLQGFAQAQQYLIKGSLNGIAAGTVKLYQPNIDNRTEKIIDSGTIKNNAFELKGIVHIPQMMSIVIEPGNWKFSVFVENNVLNLTADTAGAQHYDYTAYGSGKGAIIKKFTETGSKNYDDWIKYENNPGQKQYAAVSAKLDEKFKATANDIDAQYKVRDEMDSVKKLLQAWQKAQIDDYVHQNPSSVAGIYMFDQLYQFISGSMSYPDLTAMLDKFAGEAKESIYYDYLLKEKMKLAAVQPGMMAPDFTLLKRDSTKFTLSSVTKGQYTMIDFWASWCHPCRQAIPHWKTIYQKYHNKGFDIISVSDDNSWKNWTKAMDQEQMPWTQVDDEFPIKHMPAKVASNYMTTFIPFYVLLDKEGKILVYTGDKAKIDEKLKEIYGE